MIDNARLDALVAEQVMGWAIHNDDYAGLRWHSGNEVITAGQWHPSTDIAQAWQVVERMRALGADVNIISCDNYEVTFNKEAKNMAGLPEWIGVGTAATAPLAIVLAALQAVGVEVDND